MGSMNMPCLDLKLEASWEKNIMSDMMEPHQIYLLSNSWPSPLWMPVMKKPSLCVSRDSEYEKRVYHELSSRQVLDAGEDQTLPSRAWITRLVDVDGLEEEF